MNEFNEPQWGPIWQDNEEWVTGMMYHPNELEGRSIADLRDIFEEAGYQEVEAVQLRSCAMIVTPDCQGVEVLIGESGTYKVITIFEDVLAPSQREIAAFHECQRQLPGLMREFNVSDRFGAFLAQMVYKSDDIQEEPIDLIPLDTDFLLHGDDDMGYEVQPMNEWNFQSPQLAGFIHPRARDIIGIVQNPEFLESMDVSELKHMLREKYDYLVSLDGKCGSEIIGWGSMVGEDPLTRTQAGLVTNDKHPIILGLGPNGRYFAQVLAQDDGYPTRWEEEEVMALLRENAFHWIECTPSFKAFLDRVRTRVDVRKEYPVAEWYARMRDTIRFIAWRMTGGT
jgi:hypothetical protein